MQRETPPDAGDGNDRSNLDDAAPESDVAPACRTLKVEELARLLGVNRKTIYAAIERGEIPGVRRIGKAVRISRVTVLAWIDQGQGRAVHSRRSR